MRGRLSTCVGAWLDEKPVPQFVFTSGMRLENLRRAQAATIASRNRSNRAISSLLRTQAVAKIRLSRSIAPVSGSEMVVLVFRRLQRPHDALLGHDAGHPLAAGVSLD